MYTCEIIKENADYRFECLDYRGYSVFRSVDFDSKDEAILRLSYYLNNVDKDDIYEVCEGDDCHYFKITLDGVLLLESRSFNRKQSAYDFVESLKGGCLVSHIIDKSFDDGEVYYYLSCTSGLQFKSPIKISIEKEDNEFVASIPDLNVFSYSDDLSEVIEELKLDLDDLFDDLFLKKHKLSSNALKLKEQFASKLIQNGVS